MTLATQSGPQQGSSALPQPSGANGALSKTTGQIPDERVSGGDGGLIFNRSVSGSVRRCDAY